MDPGTLDDTQHAISTQQIFIQINVPSILPYNSSYMVGAGIANKEEERKTN